VLPPRAFHGPPTLQDVIAAVNANGDRVVQLQTQGATLALPSVPILQADLALERPYRFRMRAELTGFTGPELDLGGNDEMLWLWFRRGQPPAVYYVRRDQYAASAARSVLPVEPEWLTEAIGIVRLDPMGVHEGPYPCGVGRLEVRSRVMSSGVELTKRTVIDDAYGWVLEQHLYDPTGRLLASARSSQHRFYPQAGVSLPHRVEVQVCPLHGSEWLSFQLDVSSYLINQLYADPVRLWAPPQPDGCPLVDLADPRAFLPLQGPEAEAWRGHQRRMSALPPQTPYRPSYRGYTATR
jgi:hypothetical protein